MNNLYKAKGLIIWLTGLSGAGKTTIATRISSILDQDGYAYELIDGDILRRELNCDLGFDNEGRKKNINIAGYIANKLSEHGVIVLVSLISPFRDQRDEMRKKLNNFIEVYVNAPLKVCIQRDKKGLYKKALNGEIKNFTGISHSYEPPYEPDIELRTDKETIEESVRKILDYLKSKKFISEVS